MKQRKTVTMEHLEEVVGEVINIRGLPPESVAIHANRDAMGPLWVVSHIESGHWLSRANTVPEAIDPAQKAVLRRSPERLADLIESAIIMRQAIEDQQAARTATKH